MKLLTPDNPKLRKGEQYGYLSAVLHLAPHKSSGVANVCPDASDDCIAACLNLAGLGKFANVQAGRIRRTAFFKEDSKRFVDVLERDIASLIRRAEKAGMIPAVRLNGTSDLPWERIKGSSGETLLEVFPELRFYDYTKVARRMLAELPANYSLTFSRSEVNEARCDEVLAAGGNVAVVFAVKKGAPLPEFWRGYPVIDGDESDLRFLDPPGVVVGLRYKLVPGVDPLTSDFVVKVAA